MSTMPVYSTPERTYVFEWADDLFNIIFSVEFIARCTVVCFRPNVKQELCDFFMIVDFLAILPAMSDWLVVGREPFVANQTGIEEDRAIYSIMLVSS
jgi:hypothetical protein